MKILLTGVAGFIGMHTAERLLREGHILSGLDNLNDYYEVDLKLARLENLDKFERFSFIKADISEVSEVGPIFESFQPDVVINLAAQAGVRNSIESPMSYIFSNLVGFGNILELCKLHNIRHLIYASSSSVYGLNEMMPFSEKHSVDHPLALYGATKKSNELMAHSYSHLFDLPTTGLRFFTVYGPWGRPDMALFKFTEAIYQGKPISIFNYGNMVRDFTYIDDIVDGIVRVLDQPPVRDNDIQQKDIDGGNSRAPWKIFNIGRVSRFHLLILCQLWRTLSAEKR